MRRAGTNGIVPTKRVPTPPVGPSSGPVKTRARSSVQVTVSARHGHLGDEIQAQLKEKGEKLLHFFSRLTMNEVTVDLHKERDGKLKVEVIATAEHDHEF